MITIIFVVLFLIACLVNFLLFKNIKNKIGILERQNVAIEKASQNMKHLVNYSDIISNIEKDHKEIYIQIKEAKTDEEVNNIIRNVIDINNKHVHND